MSPYVIAAAVATLVGGVLSLQLRKHVQLVTAFSSGLLVGAALFDLLPEGLAAGGIALLDWTAFGFIGFYLLDLLLPEHHAAGHEDHKHAPSQPRVMGVIGAVLIVLHSAIDGTMLATLYDNNDGVGHESPGLAVAIHRFVDGITLVSMMLRNGQPIKRTRWMLIVVGTAPILGASLLSGSTFLHSAIGPMACTFAGAFLYIGGTHLPTHEHGADRRFAPLIASIGFAIAYVITR